MPWDLQTKQELLEKHACDFDFSVAKVPQKMWMFWKENIFWITYCKKQTKVQQSFMEYLLEKKPQ